MPGTVGGSLAGHGEGEQLFFTERVADQLVHGESAGDGRGGGGPEAGAEGHFLVDLHLDAAVGHAEMLEQVERGDAGAVLLGVFRELTVVAGDLGDVQAGLVAEAHDDLIAG